jgi:hypothetical protein
MLPKEIEISDRIHTDYIIKHYQTLSNIDIYKYRGNIAPPPLSNKMTMVIYNMIKKTFVAAVALAIIAAAILVVITADNDPDAYSEKEVAFTDRNVAVFSDDEFFIEVKEYLSASTSNVYKKSDLSDIMPGEIAVISESWIYENDRKKIDRDIGAALKNNIPLIFVGNDLYIIKESSVELETFSYSGDEDIYCVYKDKINFTCGFSGVDDEQAMKQAMQRAYMWADVLSSAENPAEVAPYFPWV